MPPNATLFTKGLLSSYARNFGDYSYVQTFSFRSSFGHTQILSLNNYHRQLRKFFPVAKGVGDFVNDFANVISVMSTLIL